MYITYNDPPSGIYNGQVLDVCEFLREEFNVKITLVALISMRGFFANRRKLKDRKFRVCVLPMFPGPQNWRRNSFLLRVMKWFRRPAVVIARGPFACSLAIRIFNEQRVVFDGRGAYDAEFNEYDVAGLASLRKEIADVEKNAVLNSDFRIAVSSYLVRYWKSQYSFDERNYAIIPCTLDSGYVHTKQVRDIRNEMGWTPDAVVIVYSGSVSGWQTLKQMDELLYPLMNRQPDLCLLLLVPKAPGQLKILDDFKERVAIKWMSPQEVQGLISGCDYGWLVREKSVTNEVASPVKFAEYLAAGLKVITSPFMGDNTDFVNKHDCGIIAEHELPASLPAVTVAERTRIRSLAEEFFTKKKYTAQYRAVLHEVNE